MPALVSNILVDDPDLGSGLDEPRLRRARRDLVAGVLTLRGHRWTPGDEAEALRAASGC